MANKKNKKKAQQPAPANSAAANSKVEAKKAVAKKNENSAKSKKNEKKHIGHRQPYTKVEITKIAL